MTLDIKDIRFETEVPDLPRTLPVVRCKAPDLDARAGGIDALVKRLELGDVIDIDTEFGIARASKLGAVEMYAASGALWSENVTHDMDAQDEFRDWPDLEETKDGTGALVQTLGRDSASKAIRLAEEMIDMGQFDMKHARAPEVRVMQVSSANEEGKTLRTGVGEATVVVGYEVDGLPVIGAGAKTMVDVIPKGGEMLATGAINVWRTPTSTERVHVGGTESALEMGLLRDPDLTLAAEKGGRITIQHLRVGLMSMPAAVQQSVLFPVMEYEARVDFDDDKQQHYFTGRVARVTRPRAYRRLGFTSTHFGLGVK